MKPVGNTTQSRYPRLRVSLTIGIIAFAVTFLYLSPTASADTATLNPNAAGNYGQWTWIGEAADYTCWQSDDADTTYATTGTRNRNHSVNLDDVSLVGTVNSVTVYAKARQTTGDEFIQLLLRTYATDYLSASTGVVPTTYAVYSNTWASNPNSGAPWTWSEINALDVGVRSIRNGGTWTGELRVTKVWVVVDYTPPDTQAPTTWVSTSPSSADGSGGWFVSVPSVTLTPDEPATTYYSWVSSSGPFTTYSGAFSAPLGETTLYYYSVDTSSNSETVKSTLFKVDTSLPSSAIGDPSGGQRIAGSSYVVSGSSSDTYSGVSQVEVRVDSGPWNLATGTSSWSYTWTLPADGSYTLWSRATDNAGNVKTDPAGTVVTVDNTAPTVTGTSPTNGAIDVAIGSNVSATFSEDMDSSTISASTFTLADGGPVAGVVTYNAATKTATFNPDSNLSYLTTYTATVTTGAKDLSGPEHDITEDLELHNRSRDNQHSCRQQRGSIPEFLRDSFFWPGYGSWIHLCLTHNCTGRHSFGFPVLGDCLRYFHYGILRRASFGNFVL